MVIYISGDNIDVLKCWWVIECVQNVTDDMIHGDDVDDFSWGGYDKKNDKMIKVLMLTVILMRNT